MIFEKKSKNFKSLIFLFFLFSFFISLFLNFNSYEDKLENSIFLQIEVNSSLADERVEMLERKILQFKNVKRVRYYSKEEGIKSLERELNISIPSGNSTLPDIMIIYVPDRESAEKLISDLDGDENIQEFYLDDQGMERALLKKKIFKLLKLLTLSIFILPSMGVVLSLCYGMRENNLIYFYLTSRERDKLQEKAKKVSLFPMVFSAVIGVLLYLNLYLFLQINLVRLGENFMLVSPEFLGMITGVGTVFLLIIVQLSPFSKKYRKDAND